MGLSPSPSLPIHYLSPSLFLFRPFPLVPFLWKGKVNSLSQSSAAVAPILNETIAGNSSSCRTFFQNFVLISKKYWYFLSYHVNIYVIIIIRVKVADGTLPYWKLWFSSTNFKIFQSQKLLAAFCWKLQIYSKEVLVNEINRKINSDKFSCSYDDLYLGVSVSFWDSGYLAKWCSNKVNVQSS